LFVARPRFLGPHDTLPCVLIYTKPHTSAILWDQNFGWSQGLLDGVTTPVCSIWSTSCLRYSLRVGNLVWLLLNRKCISIGRSGTDRSMAPGMAQVMSTFPFGTEWDSGDCSRGFWTTQRGTTWHSLIGCLNISNTNPELFEHSISSHNCRLFYCAYLLETIRNVRI